MAKRKFRIRPIYVLAVLAVAVILAFLYLGSKNSPSIASDLPSQQSPAAQDQSQTETKFDLKIEKLSINVPIILNIDGANKEEYFKALEGGVAQMKNSAAFGRGNTVIFGHSSYYKDKPGDYKEIFATLDQLETGDKITVSTEKKDYTYEVRDSKTVEPDDVSVVANTKKSQLTLITCWPPGTIDKRLVVIADQTY